MNRGSRRKDVPNLVIHPATFRKEHHNERVCDEYDIGKLLGKGKQSPLKYYILILFPIRHVWISESMRPQRAKSLQSC